jgi:hypothetical protein
MHRHGRAGHKEHLVGSLGLGEDWLQWWGGRPAYWEGKEKGLMASFGTVGRVTATVTRQMEGQSNRGEDSGGCSKKGRQAQYP